ncbi:MAG: matrixin family metalloprotease [Acidimicrobiia bacterium]|nr:matrixin family metalloprotease [Acidimicrobiia bacterium]
MKTFDNRLRHVRWALILIAAAAALASVPIPASAYVLQTSACSTGQKWNTSSPVKVRLLGDSVLDYLNTRGGGSSLADLVRLDADIKAVIALFNAIPGSSLELVLESGITGDSDLGAPGSENYGGQTIVVGFTSTGAGTSGPEAWMSPNPADGCTRTRAHISFRKDFNWIFGPPDSNDVDGRAFYTAAQPNKIGSALPRTFGGILTHEMGHAVGLAHPDDSYAVMAQNFRTWFRGPNHILKTRLLPDDTAGILALYLKAGVPRPLDVSATATWYKSAEQQFDTCTTQIAQVDAAARAVSQATGLPIGADFPAENIFKGEFADLFQALATAQDALRACEDAKNAMQLAYCKVSSRGDSWADRVKGDTVFCAVNTAGTSYPRVSQKVCPSGDIQLRYSLNNHTSLKDVLVKSQVWFSKDKQLNVRDGSDTQSPDIRQFTVKAADCATIGNNFRLPGSISSGETLYVFVRAITYDVKTGANLFDNDIEPWNNATMMRHSITVDSSVCR